MKNNTIIGVSLGVLAVGIAFFAADYKPAGAEKAATQVYWPSDEVSCPGPTDDNRPYKECVDQYPILEEALAMAEAEDKEVLLVLGANWCGACYEMRDALEAVVLPKSDPYYYIGMEQDAATYRKYIASKVKVVSLSVEVEDIDNVYSALGIEPPESLPETRFVDPKTKRSQFVYFEWISPNEMQAEFRDFLRSFKG